MECLGLDELGPCFKRRSTQAGEETAQAIHPARGDRPQRESRAFRMGFGGGRTLQADPPIEGGYVCVLGVELLRRSIDNEFSLKFQAFDRTVRPLRLDGNRVPQRERAQLIGL